MSVSGRRDTVSVVTSSPMSSRCPRRITAVGGRKVAHAILYRDREVAPAQLQRVLKRGGATSGLFGLVAEALAVRPSRS